MTNKKKYFIESVDSGILFEASSRKQMELLANIFLADSKLRFKKEAGLFK